MISALLFDLDGTLFDSSEANIFAYSKAFEQAGVTFDEKQYRHLFGLRFGEMMDEIAPDSTPEARDQIKALKSQFYKDSLRLVKKNDALIELAKSAKPTFKTALVTTASRSNVNNLLGHFEIPTTTFDVVIVGEDVKNSKPDPEAYLTAMGRLGVTPEDCCIFEDSTVGIEAAQRAGARVIKISL